MTKQLDPLAMNLFGRHLIEASAGTGKTYNITRIYARLLVEKKLSVKQILVMTFTEAATEEIRERIASFLDELIANWFDKPCQFSLDLKKRVDADKAFALLEIAKLELDLAAIYTIHGFCQRVISRYGLFMSIAQNTQLQSDFSKVLRTCVADCLLKLRADDYIYQQLQTDGWNNPDKVTNEFSSLLLSDHKISVVDKSELVKSQVRLFNHVWDDLKDSRLALQKLIHNHKEDLALGLADTLKNRQKVQEESDAVHAWLHQSTLLDPATAQETVLQWLNKTLSNDVIIGKAFTALLGTRRKNAIYKKKPEFCSHLVFKYAQEIDTELRQVGVDSELKKGLIQQFSMADGNHALHQLIALARERLRQHKEKYKIIGFDDLIANVAKAIKVGDDSLVQSLREEYPIALVDEFQDTDEHQYSILDKLYPSSSEQFTAHESVSLANSDESIQTPSNELLLVMIGDPKQAIYSFRGGDIFTYLQAKLQADFVWNMGVNYRSSAAVVNTYNRIFYGQNNTNEVKDSEKDLLDEKNTNIPINQHQDQQVSPANLFEYNINYHWVTAPKIHPKKMALLDSDKTKLDIAFNFICSESSRVSAIDSAGRNRKIETPIKFQQYQILQGCAREIQRLLGSCDIALGTTAQAIQPSDIAILVRSGNQAKMVKRVFDEYGLATVALSEKALLFQSREAINITWLLEALQHPSKNNIRKALTTGLLYSAVQHALSPELIATHNEDKDTPNAKPKAINHGATDRLLQNELDPEWEFVYQRLAELASLWKNKNIHALLQLVVQSIDFQSTHSANNIERSLTNYLHLAEVLGEAEIVQRAPLQLLYWLKQQIQAPEKNDASQLRLESDQKLIKIVTQHKSKGLEYPIVFLPFANHYFAGFKGQYTSYHDQSNKRVDQLGKTLEAEYYATKEQLAEDMRILYVSLTRPILRCYLGITGNLSGNKSALQRALGISIDGKEEYADLGMWMQKQVQGTLSDIATLVNCDQANDLINTEIKQNNRVQEEYLNEAHVLIMQRFIDHNWQVTSFSRMANAFEKNYASSIHYQAGVSNINTPSFLSAERHIETSRDEEESPVLANSYVAGLPDKDTHFAGLLSSEAIKNKSENVSKVPNISYAFTFPKGPDAGNFLHDLLETMDFYAFKDSDASGDDLKLLAQQLGVGQINGEKIDFARLYHWLNSALSTSLNHENTLCLGNLLADQVLKESEFYFPIEGLNMPELAAFVSRNRQRVMNTSSAAMSLPVKSTLTPNEFNSREVSKRITGAMHGFIDLIFEFEGQYFVCDYKSNFLGFELRQYEKMTLSADIIHHNYDLQYLIYSLALHRYLQHKLPNYSYEEHAGGVYYLYLRGMSGQGNESGVYFDKVPFSTIQTLDDLFSNNKVPSEMVI